ncbi:dipeptide ABC transporter ATP-binding protein [Metallumcola ferriviriculae]|uniref:Dipeptide ABC transporter ATP-binding protein n=1 Tax=Metallumcola ferriviriculae TaxID=3039180 RepID=A0AAU0UK84_9FIRM|nr:dipeptide ABC transporter ATP-binding protein [Desulfitibacteraceae bacterium MK1]
MPITIASSTGAKSLIDVQDLCKYFPISKGIFSGVRGQVHAVDKVSFSIEAGETFGLVGESGCGKTTVARLILRLLKPSSGNIYFQGNDITAFKERRLRYLRREMQIIFQDPMASLNPRLTIGELIGEPLEIHGVGNKKERKQNVKELLDAVGLQQNHYYHFPHELSGGQRQRVGIARALALRPKLIIADEPVSALDVSIRSQIINLLRDLQEEFNLTYLFITHDMSVIKHISNRVGVMYLGKILELAPKETLFRQPRHPYTQALLSAIPIPNPEIERTRILLQGDIPNPINPPLGCPFHTRCLYASNRCKEEEPLLRQVEGGHFVACHL